MSEVTRKLTSVELARQTAEETADMGPEAVGDFLRREDLGDGVYDFRFESGLTGYEHWQWAVTLYHDTELDEWTVNEAALLPMKRSLVAPNWVPFRDRLPGQSDEEIIQDLEPGSDESEGGQQRRDRDGNLLDPADSDEDIAEALTRFHLTRRLVPSPKGLQDTAQRWADSSSRLHSRAKGVVDGFVVPLDGFLGRFYGVCTNKHCRYDGKVVPLNHTCADPVLSDQDVYKDLWPEDNPLVDSMHIDVFGDDASHTSLDDSDENSRDDSHADSNDDLRDTDSNADDDTLDDSSTGDGDYEVRASEAEQTLGSDPRYHDVIENIDDMSVPDDDSDSEFDENDDEADRGRSGRSHRGNSYDEANTSRRDESLLSDSDESANDPHRLRALQQGFMRVRRRRRRS